MASSKNLYSDLKSKFHKFGAGAPGSPLLTQKENISFIIISAASQVSPSSCTYNH